MRAVLATSRSAFAEAWSNRSAFWVQVTAIVVNDVVWVIFWAIFFDRVGAVRGWDRDQVLLLLSMLCTCAGFSLGFLANARRIGWLAAEGELDSVLALPVPPLAYLLVRRVDAVHMGDIGFGIVLFLAIGTPSVERTLLFVVGVVTGILVMTGFLVLAGSLAFFTGRGESGDAGFNALLVLASYPTEIFSGGAKVLLYTLVPAALVAAGPSRLVADPAVTDALALLGAGVVFAAAGWWTFTVGLRRYTSGSVWTRA